MHLLYLELEIILKHDHPSYLRSAAFYSSMKPFADFFFPFLLVGVRSRTFSRCRIRKEIRVFYGV